MAAAPVDATQAIASESQISAAENLEPMPTVRVVPLPPMSASQQEPAPPASIAPEIVRIGQRDAEEPSPYVEELAPEPPAWWQKPITWVGFGTLLFAFLAYGTRDFWLGMDKSAVGNTTSPTAASNATASGPTKMAYYAMRKLKLRDKATTEGSVVKGEVPRGATLTGIMQLGDDGKTQWLKLDGTGYFVSLANLSETAPPPLRLMINKALTVDEATTIRVGPSDTAAPKDSLSAGAKVEAVGVTNDGWIEITLKTSGVGYFKPSETSANASLTTGAAVPVAVTATNFDQLVQFNADTCSFGPAMDAIYSSMGPNVGKGPYTPPGLGGQYTATQSGTEANAMVKLQISGKYKGLNVSGLYTAYEGLGMYFSDSVDNVGKALEPLGFFKSEDGTYVTNQDGAGGYVKSEGGRTMLYCGA